MNQVLDFIPVKANYGFSVNNQRWDGHAAGFIGHFVPRMRIGSDIKVLIGQTFP